VTQSNRIAEDAALTIPNGWEDKIKAAIATPMLIPILQQPKAVKATIDNHARYWILATHSMLHLWDSKHRIPGSKYERERVQKAGMWLSALHRTCRDVHFFATRQGKVLPYSDAQDWFLCILKELCVAGLQQISYELFDVESNSTYQTAVGKPKKRTKRREVRIMSWAWYQASLKRGTEPRASRFAFGQLVGMATDLALDQKGTDGFGRTTFKLFVDTWKDLLVDVEENWMIGTINNPNKPPVIQGKGWQKQKLGEVRR
jgi:hypothetical protein